MTIDLGGWARDRNVRYLLVSFTDLLGTQRAKLIPADAAAEFQANGVSFSGYACWLGLPPSAPEAIARPDVSTIVQLPWKPDVAWLIADIQFAGLPLATSPRQILKTRIEQAASRGLQMKTGVESEFFLLPPVPSDGTHEVTRPCYDQQALMRRFDVISEITDAMIELGWGPYQSDQEDAQSQFEINWRFADALVTADRHAFFKFMAKAIAEKHGLVTTFMPKPFVDRTGNGCHIHVSLWQGQENLFVATPGEALLSQMARWFIGGLISEAGALAGLLAPTVNSYKRLHAPAPVSGVSWAPARVSWSGNNRTHMIRVPSPDRFELRLADGAVNPYLLPAAVLVAGLAGIAGEIDPGAPLDGDMYACPDMARKAPTLPNNLFDALAQLERSAVMSDALGAQVLATYLRIKREEWKAYSCELSQWEQDTTFDC